MPWLLLFFKLFTAYNISASVNGWFMLALISSEPNPEYSSCLTESSTSWLGELLFTFLKKSYKPLSGAVSTLLLFREFHIFQNSFGLEFFKIS